MCIANNAQRLHSQRPRVCNIALTSLPTWNSTDTLFIKKNKKKHTTPKNQKPKTPPHTHAHKNSSFWKKKHTPLKKTKNQKHTPPHTHTPMHTKTLLSENNEIHKVLENGTIFNCDMYGF